jgi:P27 family predicted phage terminase small subunit
LFNLTALSTVAITYSFGRREEVRHMPGTSGSGKRPLPTAVKKLRGNPGKRALNDAEPAAAAGTPAMPKGLSPIARQEWDDIVPLLLRLNVLTELDGKALGAYCQAHAMVVAAEQDIARHGTILEEPIVDRATGEQIGVRRKMNPAFRVWDAAMGRLKSFLIEFGLSPSSRSKLRIEKPTEPDPLELYLARKANSNISALKN